MTSSFPPGQSLGVVHQFQTLRADTLWHQGQGRGIDNASPVVLLTAQAGLSEALPYLNSIAVDEYGMKAKIAD